jgi:hypothetical protein
VRRIAELRLTPRALMGRVYGFSLPPLLFVDGVYVFACGSKFDWGDYRDIRKRWGVE